MQYDPLVEILNVAESSVKHPGKSAAIRNLQSVLKADPNLSKELQKRMAAVLRAARNASDSTRSDFQKSVSEILT